jgi:methionyl aminopeptidase
MATKLSFMTEGGQRLKTIRQQVLQTAQPGVNLLDLEKLAQKLIKEINAIPNFAQVDNYGYATCLMINDEYVHSKPKKYRLKKNDLLTLDIGILWHDWHLDSADTIIIGSNNAKLEKFLQVGKKALPKAIAVAKPGNRVGHISQVIQTEIESAGYFPVHQYTGHGIGRRLHQPPNIPCWLDADPKNTPLLKVNQTLAIEVMYAQGTSQVKIDADGWTARTADGSLSAQFEHTIYLTKNGPKILT